MKHTFLSVYSLFFLLLMIAFSCAIPDTSIISFQSKDECNPIKQFAKGVTIDGKAIPLFQENKQQFGCMGVTWEGNKNPKSGYLVRIDETGKYVVYDPATAKPAAEKFGFEVPAGIEKVSIEIYFYQGNGQNLNCGNIVNASAGSCWSDKNCLLVWQGNQIPVNAETPGTCKLCSREICNGKDDDCDGQVDEESACGSVFRTDCQYITKVDEKTAGCSETDSCSCKVDEAGKIYTCFAKLDPSTGNVVGKRQWVALETVQSCTSGEKAVCGKDLMLCDTCSGVNHDVWRSQTSEHCSKKLVYQNK